jgi:hypothetical protein
MEHYESKTPHNTTLKTSTNRPMIKRRNLRARWTFGLNVASALGARAWQSDNGNGTFTNPPLYADCPDPDLIRVGEDFYFATTMFVNSPGLTILHSPAW